jgi:antitoxin component YwqK of YwqJK toxin-antitoxin module
MKEKHKKTNYPSRNIKTETYQDGDTFVTKHYYDAKDAYVKELIYLKDGIKEVQYFTTKGVLSKLDHFVEDKRQGLETKYFISKANGSVKSTKIYDGGKLHGENITYNDNTEIIKHEVYAAGKLVLKYLRKDSDSNDITNVQIIDKDNVMNLPKTEYEKLQTNIENNPNSFVE